MEIWRSFHTIHISFLFPVFLIFPIGALKRGGFRFLISYFASMLYLKIISFLFFQFVGEQSGGQRQLGMCGFRYDMMIMIQSHVFGVCFGFI